MLYFIMSININNIIVEVIKTIQCNVHNSTLFSCCFKPMVVDVFDLIRFN